MSIYTYTNEQLRIQILSDGIVRIEEAENGNFTDKPTLLVPNRENFCGTEVTLTQKEKATLLTTDSFTVKINGNTASYVDIIADNRCIFDSTTH